MAGHKSSYRKKDQISGCIPLLRLCVQTPACKETWVPEEEELFLLQQQWWEADGWLRVVPIHRRSLEVELTKCYALYSDHNSWDNQNED